MKPSLFVLSCFHGSLTPPVPLLPGAAHPRGPDKHAAAGCEALCSSIASPPPPVRHRWLHTLPCEEPVPSLPPLVRSVTSSRATYTFWRYSAPPLPFRCLALHFSCCSATSHLVSHSCIPPRWRMINARWPSPTRMKNAVGWRGIKPKLTLK